LEMNTSAARKSEDTPRSTLATPGLAWNSTQLAGHPVLRRAELAGESGKAVSSGSSSACCSLGRSQRRRRIIALGGFLFPFINRCQYQSYVIIVSWQVEVTKALLFCYNADGWRLGTSGVAYVDSARPEAVLAPDFHCEVMEY